MNAGTGQAEGNMAEEENKRLYPTSGEDFNRIEGMTAMSFGGNWRGTITRR
jgi:hypothetical protein